MAISNDPASIDDALRALRLAALDEAQPTGVSLGLGRLGRPSPVIWPPQWPPSRGLLDFVGNTETRKARSEWTADDWQQYAEHLEARGRELADRLRLAEDDLRQARAKAKRSKPKPVASKPGSTIAGLLGFGPRSRGRPKGMRDESVAAEVQALQSRMSEAAGKPVTRRAAVEQYRRDRNERVYQPKENGRIVNAMKKLAERGRKEST